MSSRKSESFSVTASVVDNITIRETTMTQLGEPGLLGNSIGREEPKEKVLCYCINQDKCKFNIILLSQ